MSAFVAESFVIIGVTTSGKRFRPSDWADRLCGVLSAYGPNRRFGYSPYAQPGTHAGEKCVFVNAKIREIEPMAYAFLSHFAKDNDLQVETWTPESPPKPLTA